MISPYLVIGPSHKGGRGVFATKNIPAGTVVEVAPVLVLSIQDRKAIEETRLFHYIFEWGKSKRLGCMAFGYMSMYNHDYTANCEYEMDYEESTMTVRTLRQLKKGDELYINYNADPNDKTPLWFDAK
ncbi:SET domain-containing protein-lysine N-methyltransferase [soil metagenome]